MKMLRFIGVVSTLNLKELIIYLMLGMTSMIQLCLMDLCRLWLSLMYMLKLMELKYCTEMFIMHMERLNKRPHIMEFLNEIITNTDHLSCHDHSSWELKSMDLLGLVTIRPFSESSKVQLMNYWPLVFLDIHLLVLIFQDTSLHLLMISLLRCTNLELSIPFSELTVNIIPKTENPGYNLKESKKLLERQFS